VNGHQCVLTSSSWWASIRSNNVSTVRLRQHWPLLLLTNTDHSSKDGQAEWLVVVLAAVVLYLSLISLLLRELIVTVFTPISLVHRRLSCNMAFSFSAGNFSFSSLALYAA